MASGPRAVAYYNPADDRGSMLTGAGSFGEPLNVIISGNSSPDVLTGDGIVHYARAIGFANLGDGNGWVNQTYELREDYDDSNVGTCLESAIGGNHFRVFRQNGTDAYSGALFLAVSQEEPSTERHTISPDGYDIGWDTLVSWPLGTTSYNGMTYSTTAENATGLLQPGTEGINHDIAIDGIVTVLTIKIV
ncbi:hypothetical protein DAEQUDRAFT_815453 [Daedalea quercina L-15889]|uniref:Uncharacterized protein n=1 Tax=Daedalea quercina L-15889 TaxID=1314783 RepID=A0A165KYM5_9APHY|nr:hypothetical protein DAEQUDRAFT_815453 [Daedalea quercina L-15889]